MLRGIEAAERAGFENIKLNCVLLGGMNDDEIGDFVRLTAKKPWQVRFIELMPMGVCAAWPPERFLPAQEILSRVPELRPAGRSGVAQLYRLPGAAGTAQEYASRRTGSSSPACTRTQSSRCAVFPARSWKRPSAGAS